MPEPGRIHGIDTFECAAHWIVDLCTTEALVTEPRGAADIIHISASHQHSSIREQSRRMRNASVSHVSRGDKSSCKRVVQFSRRLPRGVQANPSLKECGAGGASGN